MFVQFLYVGLAQNKLMSFKKREGTKSLQSFLVKTLHTSCFQKMLDLLATFQ